MPSGSSVREKAICIWPLRTDMQYFGVHALEFSLAVVAAALLREFLNKSHSQWRKLPKWMSRNPRSGKGSRVGLKTAPGRYF
jgi:hypothetical protein